MEKLFTILFLFCSTAILAQRPPVGVIASSRVISEEGGGTGDNEASNFITATGISGSNANAIDSLVLWLKDSALWNKAQIIYPVIGGNSTAHSYNLVNTSTFQLSFSGGWTQASTGMKPNGSTGYANTGWNPTTQVSTSGYATSAGVYLRSNASGPYVDIGALETQSGTDAYYQMVPYFGYNFYAQLSIKGTVGQVVNALNSSRGWFFATRNTINTEVIQQDAAQNSLPVYSGNYGQPNNNVYLGAQNQNGTAGAFSNREIAFAWISNQKLTESESLTLYRIIQKYQTLLGRAVTN